MNEPDDVTITSYFGSTGPDRDRPDAQGPVGVTTEPVGSTVKRAVTQEELDRCYAQISEPLDGHDDNTGGTSELQTWIEAATLQSRTQRANRRPATKLGIELGDTTVRLVHLNGRRRIAVMDAISLDADQSPSLRDDAIVQGVRTLLTRHRIRARQAVFCLSERCTAMRMVNLPKLKKAELAQVLLFEGKKIHSGNPSQPMVYHHLSRADTRAGHDGQSHALVMATEQAAVERVMKIAKDVGIKPIAIDVEALAIQRFYARSYVPMDGTTVVVHMHAHYSLILFIEGSQVLWAKHIAIGGTEFTTSIANMLMVDEHKAEALKREQWDGDRDAGGQDSQVSRAMDLTIDAITNEIRLTVQQFLSQHPSGHVNRMILSGNGSKYKDLEQYMSQSLQWPVVRWTVPSLYDFSDLSADHTSLATDLLGFSTCLGLCEWHKKDDAVNLLPKRWSPFGETLGARFLPPDVGDSSHSRVRQKATRVVLPAAAAAGLVLVAAGLGFQMLANPTQGQLSELRQEQGHMQTLRSQLDRIEALRQRIHTRQAMLQGLRKQQVELARPLGALNILLAPGISVLELEVEAAHMHVSGYVPRSEVLEQFVNRLGQSPHFTDIEIALVKRTPSGTRRQLYFEVKGTVPHAS